MHDDGTGLFIAVFSAAFILAHVITSLRRL